MRSMLHILLLFMLAILGSQSWSVVAVPSSTYQYDASENLYIKRNSDSETQNQYYDGILNLRHCCSDSLNKELQEKAQVGSFFAFIEGFFVPKGADKFTKEVVKRGKPGRDGGQSQHVIEKVNGQTTSTTHQVVKDGKLIHQHQDHIGKHGTVRRFSDELTGTKTINAPTIKDTMTGGRLGFPPGS